MRVVIFIAITALITLTQSTVINRSKRQDNYSYEKRFPGAVGTDAFFAKLKQYIAEKNAAAGGQSYLSCYQSCPTTSEYNPVCGTDNQTYPNRQRLTCAQRCGLNVREVRIGRCQSAESIAQQLERESRAKSTVNAI